MRGVESLGNNAPQPRPSGYLSQLHGAIGRQETAEGAYGGPRDDPRPRQPHRIRCLWRGGPGASAAHLGWISAFRSVHVTKRQRRAAPAQRCDVLRGTTRTAWGPNGLACSRPEPSHPRGRSSSPSCRCSWRSDARRAQRFKVWAAARRGEAAAGTTPGAARSPPQSLGRTPLDSGRLLANSANDGAGSGSNLLLHAPQARAERALKDCH